MNSRTNPTPSNTETIHEDDLAASKESQTVEKLARRRVLVSSVAGGVGLLAAASPIKALAQTSSCSNKQCTISGMKSANHSFKPGECGQPCGGYSPGYWGQIADCPANNQGGGNNGGGVDCKKVPRREWPAGVIIGAPVQNVLIKSSLNVSLFELMWNHKEYANTDEVHWICAWLNAQKSPPGYNFPYSAEEVKKFYEDALMYGEALSFFKNYMETHDS